MATTSYQGPGFLLKVSASDLTTMTTLAQCGDIKGGGLSVATTDVTNQDSTNGEKEEKPTVITNQKITTTCVFDPGNATQNATAGVLYLARNRLRRKFQVFSNAPTNTIKAEVYGFVTKAENGLPYAGHATLDVEITPDGPQTGPA